jgi:CHAT domain-containing protein
MFGCTNNKMSKDEGTILIKPDTTASSQISEKINLEEQKLSKLASYPDSLRSFILGVDRLYDSVCKWKSAKAGNKYLDLIIDRRPAIEKDTLLRKKLIKAYIFWGGHNYSEKYNDTLVSRLEQFLLLTEKDSAYQQFIPNAYNYLGVQYNVLGDLKKTCYINGKYIEYGLEHNKMEYYYSGLGNNSIALNEMGNYDSVIRVIENVLPHFQAEAKRKAALYVQLSLAYAKINSFNRCKEIISQGRVFLNSSLRNHKIDSSDYHSYLSQLYKQLGEVQLLQGEPLKAENNMGLALNYYFLTNSRSLKDRHIGKLFIAQARPHIAIGNYATALKLCQKALYQVCNVDSNDTSILPSINNLYPENTIMEALDCKASVLEKMCNNAQTDTAQLTQIVQCYQLAFEVESKLMQRFSYDESLMRQAKESKLRSEKAINACYRLYAFTHSPEWAQKAFQFSEKSKAIALQESVKRNLATDKALQEDTLWQKAQLYQQQVSYYEKQIAITDDSSTAEISFLKKQLSDAEERLLMAKTALLHSNSQYRNALQKTDSLTAATVGDKLLNKQTFLVEYFAGDSSTYIFHLMPGREMAFYKADDGLPAAVLQLLSFFSDKDSINNSPDKYQQAALRLYQKLCLDRITTSPEENLLIITDGILSLIPFDALVTEIKPAAPPKSFAYLLLNKQISYGFSAATLIAQANNNSTTEGLVCLAPVFAAQERGNTPLMFSEEELQAIKKEKPSATCYLKEMATLANLKKSLNSSVLHIASHANADTSGYIPSIELYDSAFYLNEIYALHISPQLVVLSACETGIGKIDKSEGALSLARGFYYAGAKNIITSLWNVDDKSTSTLFGNFYRSLKKNDYSKALQKSKTDYLRTAPETAASPYYWAAFVHIGQSKPAGPSGMLQWFFILGGLFLLSVAYFIRMRKK